MMSKEEREAARKRCERSDNQGCFVSEGCTRNPQRTCRLKGAALQALDALDAKDAELDIITCPACEGEGGKMAGHGDYFECGMCDDSLNLPRMEAEKIELGWKLDACSQAFQYMEEERDRLQGELDAKDAEIDRLRSERDMYRNRVTAREEEIEEIERHWKVASGLMVGEDPEGVTPGAMQKYWEGVEEERNAYLEALETIASDAPSGCLDRKQCARDYLDGGDQ